MLFLSVSDSKAEILPSIPLSFQIMSIFLEIPLIGSDVLYLLLLLFKWRKRRKTVEWTDLIIVPFLVQLYTHNLLRTSVYNVVHCTVCVSHQMKTVGWQTCCTRRYAFSVGWWQGRIICRAERAMSGPPGVATATWWCSWAPWRIQTSPLWAWAQRKAVTSSTGRPSEPFIMCTSTTQAKPIGS